MTHRLQPILVYQNSPYQTFPQLTLVATGGSSLNIQFLQVCLFSIKVYSLKV